MVVGHDISVFLDNEPGTRAEPIRLAESPVGGHVEKAPEKFRNVLAAVGLLLIARARFARPLPVLRHADVDHGWPGLIHKAGEIRQACDRGMSRQRPRQRGHGSQ